MLEISKAGSNVASPVWLSLVSIVVVGLVRFAHQTSNLLLRQGFGCLLLLG